MYSTSILSDIQALFVIDLCQLN